MLLNVTHKIAVDGNPENRLAIRCLGWDASGEWLAIGGDRGFLKLISSVVSTSQTLEGHKDASLIKVAWSPAYCKLTSADNNGKVIVWTVKKTSLGAPLFALEMWHERTAAPVLDMAWSETGERISIVYCDGFVQVGDVSGKRIWGRLISNRLRTVCFHGDLLVFCTSREVEAYGADDGVFKSGIKLKENWTPVKLAWGPTLLALGYSNGQVRLYSDVHVHSVKHVIVCSAPAEHATGNANRYPDGDSSGGTTQDTSDTRPTASLPPSAGTLDLTWQDEYLLVGMAGMLAFYSSQNSYKAAIYIFRTPVFRTVPIENYSVPYGASPSDRLLLSWRHEHVAYVASHEASTVYLARLRRCWRPRAVLNQGTLVVQKGSHSVLVYPPGKPPKRTVFSSEIVDICQPLHGSISTAWILERNQTLWRVLGKNGHIVPDTERTSSLRNPKFFAVVSDDVGGGHNFIFANDTKISVEGDHHFTPKGIVQIVAGGSHLFALTENGSIVDILQGTKRSPYQGLSFPAAYMFANCRLDQFLVLDQQGHLFGPASFERAGVWDCLWATDDPSKFVICEDQDLIIFHSYQPIGSYQQAGYLCRFIGLRVLSVTIPDGVFRWEDTKPLTDTRALLQNSYTDEAVAHVKGFPHPALWDLISEHHLRKGNYQGALRSFISGLDYISTHQVHKILDTLDPQEARGMACELLGDFDAASTAYLQSQNRTHLLESLGRRFLRTNKDRAVQYMERHDWARGLQLIDDTDPDLKLRCYMHFGEARKVVDLVSLVEPRIKLAAARWLETEGFITEAVQSYMKCSMPTRALGVCRKFNKRIDLASDDEVLVDAFWCSGDPAGALLLAKGGPLENKIIEKVGFAWLRDRLHHDALLLKALFVHVGHNIKDWRCAIGIHLIIEAHRLYYSGSHLKLLYVCLELREFTDVLPQDTIYALLILAAESICDISVSLSEEKPKKVWDSLGAQHGNSSIHVQCINCGATRSLWMPNTCPECDDALNVDMLDWRTVNGGWECKVCNATYQETPLTCAVCGVAPGKLGI